MRTKDDIERCLKAVEWALEHNVAPDEAEYVKLAVALRWVLGEDFDSMRDLCESIPK